MRALGVATFPIEQHRVIAGRRGSALLRPDGTIDWWCAEVDDEPLCWSLLDGSGGQIGFPGAEAKRTSDEPASALCRTRLDLPDGSLDVWDGMLESEGGTALVRLVRAAAGDPLVTVRVQLGGFDGTMTGARASSCSRRVLVDVVPEPTGPLELTLPVTMAWSLLAIRSGEVEVGSPEEVLELLLAHEEEEQRAVGRATVVVPHAERTRDALRILRACTYGPTGAPVASPTTSLPEAPGADRQFDYRYCWLRDTSYAVSVAALLGDHETGRRYLEWAVPRLGDKPTATPVSTVRGDPVPDERHVDGVDGWAASLPIRVGNAAREQRQWDAGGAVVEAMWVQRVRGGRLTKQAWRAARRLARSAAKEKGCGRSHGIWELREEGSLPSEDFGRWLLLDRAVRLHRFRPWHLRPAWYRARREAAEAAVSALQPEGWLPVAHDPARRVPDAAGLLLVIFGPLHGRRDPRARRLVDATLQSLGDGPFLRRYGDFDDGFSGEAGAFLPASWWVVSALACLGDVDAARTRADALCKALPRLLPEMVDPVTGAGLGNAPLLWSHLEAARALYLLRVAEVRRRWTSVGVVLWRASHLVRSLSARVGTAAP